MFLQFRSVGGQAFHSSGGIHQLYSNLFLSEFYDDCPHDLPGRSSTCNSFTTGIDPRLRGLWRKDDRRVVNQRARRDTGGHYLRVTMSAGRGSSGPGPECIAEGRGTASTLPRFTSPPEQKGQPWKNKRFLDFPPSLFPFPREKTNADEWELEKGSNFLSANFPGDENWRGRKIAAARSGERFAAVAEGVRGGRARRRACRIFNPSAGDD